MSCGSKKRMGFQGALLAAGLMLGTASTAFATTPDNSREREKRVEVQKKIEKHKTVEIKKQKRTSSSGAHDGRGGSGHAGWHDGDSRKRYAPPRWYSPRPASSRPRYDDHDRRDWGSGGSGHGHGHWKKYEPPRRPSHGDNPRAKYEARKERLQDRYEARKERLQDKYDDKKARLKDRYEDQKRR
jgi:hypothetical protein